MYLSTIFTACVKYVYCIGPFLEQFSVTGVPIFKASDFEIPFSRGSDSGVPVPVLDYALRFWKVLFGHFPSYFLDMFLLGHLS